MAAASPESGPASRRLESWGRARRAPAGGRPPCQGRPGRRRDNGAAGLPESPGVGWGPSVNGPLSRLEDGNGGAPCARPPKGPLGDNHPGREVEVAIRVFIGGQASLRTVGHSAFRPSLSLQPGTPRPIHGGWWGEGWASPPRHYGD